MSGELYYNNAYMYFFKYHSSRLTKYGTVMFKLHVNVMFACGMVMEGNQTSGDTISMESIYIISSPLDEESNSFFDITVWEQSIDVYLQFNTRHILVV